MLLCCCTASNKIVPVIDISILYDETAFTGLTDAYMECAQQIDAALTGHGLFGVTGHMLTGPPSTEGLNAAKNLFRYDKSELNRVRVQRKASEESESESVLASTTQTVHSEAMRGYIAFGAESGLQGKFFEAKEGFSYGFGTLSAEGEGEREGEVCTACTRTPLHGDNVWPAPPCVHEDAVPSASCAAAHAATVRALECVFSGTVGISMVLSRAIAAINVHRIDLLLQVAGDADADAAEAVGVDQRAKLLEQRQRWASIEELLRCGDEISILRLFHYNNIDKLAAAGGGEQEQLSSELGSSPHTDWGFLTVILQDGVGGLQFLDREDAVWTDVVPVEGAIVINGGDYLSLYSGQRYHSPVHRVLAPRGEDSDRFSFVLFFYPNYFSVVPSEVEVAEIAVGNIEEHNTLLDCADAPATAAFGDYMIEKWRGVFNSKY